jgi:hypothetical protein
MVPWDSYGCYTHTALQAQHITGTAVTNTLVIGTAVINTHIAWGVDVVLCPVRLTAAALQSAQRRVRPGRHSSC